MTIREAARNSGISEDTLRYYEKVGLIPPVKRDPSGHRNYSEQDLAWLEFLIRLRETGMPISTMKTFAQLRQQGNITVPTRKTLLEQHLNDLEARIELLSQHTQAIRAKIQHYQTLEESL